MQPLDRTMFRLPAVFTSLPPCSDIPTIIYIGKAGTLMRDGSFKEQKLRRRLTNLQGRIRRTVFFRDYIFKRNLAGLMFEWFVTFDGNVRDLPLLAEAKLLQEFFNEHGCLPELNSCA